ncbi:MAG: hypothetical protein RR448_08625 [Niameybacter sp.]|uniref:hypothetical protein n=1 Tax=Niameybacter sp. TaxID=2033640 RepID=UPI002FC7EE4C
MHFDCMPHDASIHFMVQIQESLTKLHSLQYAKKEDTFLGSHISKHKKESSNNSSGSGLALPTLQVAEVPMAVVGEASRFFFT